MQVNQIRDKRQKTKMTEGRLGGVGSLVVRWRGGVEEVWAWWPNDAPPLTEHGLGQRALRDDAFLLWLSVTWDSARCEMMQSSFGIPRETSKADLDPRRWSLLLDRQCPQEMLIVVEVKPVWNLERCATPHIAMHWQSAYPGERSRIELWAVLQHAFFH